MNSLTRPKFRRLDARIGVRDGFDCNMKLFGDGCKSITANDHVFSCSGNGRHRVALGSNGWHLDRNLQLLADFDAVGLQIIGRPYGSHGRMELAGNGAQVIP